MKKSLHPVIAMAQIFVLGFASTLVQVIMMREFMFVFGGNELIIGVILANWMVITGIGALAGKTSAQFTHKERFAKHAIVLLGWIPPVLFCLIEISRNTIFSPGIEAGFFQVTISTIAFLAPFCFLSGFLFTCLAEIIRGHITSIPGEKAYAIESAGSLVSGVFASFIIFSFLSNFQALLLLPLCTGIFLLVPCGKKGTLLWHILLYAAMLCSISVMFILKADYRLKPLYFRQQEVLFFRDTPYGNLAITKTAGQLNIFDNGKLLFSTDNLVANEEAVHYAMAQHPGPREVLLISGGISGITGEILKYDVVHVDYVEINPVIFDLGRRYTSALKDPRIQTVEEDARMFLKTSARAYDVVLINLPEPSTAQLNRFYTKEFLLEIKDHLKKDGIITLNMPSTANYLNDEALQLNSVIYNTCRSVFTDVLILPGERNYYLASDRTLKIDFSYLIINNDIKTDYFNYNYIDTLSLKERSDHLMEQLNRDAEVNLDFRPVSYYYYLGYWLSQFNLGKDLLWVIFALFLLILFSAGIFFKPVTSSLLVTGFAASSLEIILLLTLQILTGYIYQVVGVCIAVFMGGLALGALIRALIFPRISPLQFTVLQIVASFLALLIPILLINDSVQSNIYLATGIVLLMLFFISLITGVLFSLSLRLRTSNLTDNIAVLYSADLIGSALGALLTSILLIPMLGIMNTSRLVGGLLLLYAINLLLRRKSI